MSEPELTTRSATPGDVDAVHSNRAAHELWSRAGHTRQPNWARWVKPTGRRAAGA